MKWKIIHCGRVMTLRRLVQAKQGNSQHLLLKLSQAADFKLADGFLLQPHKSPGPV